MSFFKNIIWSPENYAEASVLAHEVGDEMCSRLDWMTLKPKLILDAGCGTGKFSAKLQSLYPEAKVLALDMSEKMINYTKKNSSDIFCVHTNAGNLPLTDHSVDLIFANLILPWCEDIPTVLKEWRRVLRPDGLLMLTTFGLDTLKEWNVNRDDSPAFIDMHDLGDLLLQVGLSDPVIDVNHYTLSYREQEKLFQELKAFGMLMEPPKIISDNLDITYEVVFAHCFAPAESEEVSPDSDGIVRIPLSHLRKWSQSKS